MILDAIPIKICYNFAKYVIIIEISICKGVAVQTVQIPVTDELKEFLDTQYKNKAAKLVDDFVIYLNTKKEASEITKALKDVKENKTNDIKTLLNDL